MFTGTGEPKSYAADELDRILIDRATIRFLGSIEAVCGYFDAAEFTIPPLVVAAGEEEMGNG